MKLVIVGPTYPFRGGIAHYTTFLCNALREKHEVTLISFKYMYPRLLFGGATDRDTSREPVRSEDVQYLIHSMNPLSWKAAADRIAELKPEKLIFPWWVSFWTPMTRFIVGRVRKRHSCEIVFICHNVVEHSGFFFSRWATKLGLSSGDRFITHASRETGKLRSILGEQVNVTTAFLPTYKGLGRVNVMSKDEAKRALGLEGDVLMFFGFVRRYKGLGVLLDAMPQILKKRGVNLLVVGEIWQDREKYLAQIKERGIASRVRFIEQYVPDEEVGRYFAAADLVVQPYLSASGSAVSQLAYGYDRPVIATEVGSLPEVIEDGVNGRVVPPGNASKLAEAVSESLEPGVLERLTENASKTKEKFSWDRMTDIVTGSS